MVDLRLRKRRAVEPDGSFARRTRQDVRTHPIKTRRDVCPAALVLDQKKLVAFSVVAGRFLRFPIGDRRGTRMRASVGNAGGNAGPSLLLLHHFPPAPRPP